MDNENEKMEQNAEENGFTMDNLEPDEEMEDASGIEDLVIEEAENVSAENLEEIILEEESQEPPKALGLSFRERSERKRLREQRKKRAAFNPKRIVAGVMVAILFIAICTVVVKKYAPSKNVMELTEYYKVADDEVMIVLHDEIEEEKGIYENGHIYLPYELVVGGINKRFYFDSKENILSFTNATEIIRAEVGAKEYYINKSKTTLDYPIVKTNGEAVYICLDYIKLFSNVEYEFFESPNRVVVEAGWGNTYSYYSVNKSTKLRFAQSIKSDVLAPLEESDVLRVVDTEDELLEGYAKVMTKDGVIGFVQTKYLSDVYEEKLTNDYKEESYPHISKEETINLVWHQVTSQAANNNLLSAISNTKGVNCISPTWFSILNNDGELSSLASENYVKRAHDNGLEVWALCDDFRARTDEIDLATVLGNTTSRDKLVNGLIANAIQYNLDGINIDFEYISKKSASAYLEFLRELSVKCRNNGIVLSVDTYVPSEYTAYYDREEQGKIVDYVIVMAYDEHYAGSEESGSVASIGFVEEAVNNIVKMVDPSQVIIAMPFYCRQWREQTTDGETKVSSVAYGMEQAANVLKQNGVEPVWDDETGQYYGEFESGDSVYKIWLEDDKSIELKLKTIFKERKQGKVAGVASWKLGLQKKSVWNVIKKYTN